MKRYAIILAVFVALYLPIAPRAATETFTGVQLATAMQQAGLDPAAMADYTTCTGNTDAYTMCYTYFAVDDGGDWGIRWTAQGGAVTWQIGTVEK